MVEQKKLRRSRQRTSILRYLRSTDSHPTAQEIFDKLRHEYPHLSLGTVYRNLNILVEQGEIRRMQYGSTFDRYDGHAEPHYHFICNICHKVYDLDVDPMQEMQRHVDSRSPHSIHSHKVEFYGICEECKTKMKQ